MAHIARKIVQPQRSSLRFVETFLKCCGVTERSTRRTSSLCGRESFSDQPLCLDIYVRLDFFPEVSITTPPFPKHVSCLSWLTVKYSSDGGCNAPPFAFLASELVASFSSEAIEPRFPIVIGHAPLSRNEVSILKTL